MPKFKCEINVIKRLIIEIEAPDIQEARQQLNNLEFDPEDASEVVGWKVSPHLQAVEESRPHGSPASALDLYNLQMKPKLE